MSLATGPRLGAYVIEAPFGAGGSASGCGEGRDDWSTVKEFFWSRVGHLLIPPARELQIEQRVIDVVET
jgi:hypothetical protein